MLEKRLIEAFAQGCKPPEKKGIVAWAGEFVTMLGSHRAEKCDLTQTPWLIEPLEWATSYDLDELVIAAPTGSGKTSMLLCLANFIPACMPGPSLFTIQGNAEAAEFYSTRLLPSLKANPLLDGLWPKNRHAVSQGLINWPHMAMHLSGANHTAFQSRSIDWLVMDEVWTMAPGLLGEARRRKHSRPFARSILLSQPGNQGDDFDHAFNDCLIADFCLCCPGCGHVGPWSWSNLRWDVEKNPRGEYIFKSIKARYECPCCGHVTPDTPEGRRSLAETGRYVARDGGNPKSGHYAYTWNALSVWWVEWGKELVVEFLQAQELAKKGFPHGLKQFRNKRLAETWMPQEELECINIPRGGYRRGQSPLLDVTILAVDIQKDLMWWVLQTWSRSGESRIVDYGKFLTFDDIKKKQEQYSLPPICVFLDGSGYREVEVKLALAQNSWIGLNGVGSESFSVPWKGKQVQRIYSTVREHATAAGIARVFAYSSHQAKEMVCALKAGDGLKWEVPEDACQQFIDSLNSEAKKLTAKGKVEYVQIRDHNHYFDACCQSLIGAILHKCLPDISKGPLAEAA